MKPKLNFLNSPVWEDAPSYPDTLYIRRFRAVSVLLAWTCLGLAFIGGLDSISAWYWSEHHAHTWFGLPHQPFPVLICFVLASLSVLSQRYHHRTRWLQSALGAAVIGLGFFTVNPETPSLWHVDRLTGWVVLLVGFALGAGASRLSMIGYVRQFAIFVIFFLCGLVVVGHLNEVSGGELYLSNYMQTPWPTALNGLVIAHALLFQHPNFGVMQLVSGTGFGSQLMRRLLPSMIVLLVLLGWVLAFGEHHGWYPPSFGEGLYAVLAITGFSGILMFTAMSINRIDSERREREKDVLRQQEQLQAILDHTTSIVCMKDLDGRYLMVNKSFSDLFGKRPESCIGLTIGDFYPEHIARVVQAGYDKAVELGAPVEQVETYEVGGTSCHYLSARFPLLNSDGDPYAVCGIYTDITDLKRREEEIRGLNESLREKTRRQEAANNELEAFSYSVSHDLRAPLRHIAGFGQLLAQRNRDNLDEKSRHYLDVIQTSVKRMGDLIDDLLSFSRASKVELAPKRVQTFDLVTEVRAEIEAGRDTGQKRSPIAWEIGPLPDTHGDPAMLRLVWVNLLSNAVKYSSKNPSPRITVRYGPEAGEPGVFTVRDNGAGFDMRYADKLFGVFQRLHSTQEYDGTGIGLAMVRRIIERHGGRIWAEAAPGEGACFYFVLPVTNRNADASGVPEEAST